MKDVRRKRMRGTVISRPHSSYHLRLTSYSWPSLAAVMLNTSLHAHKVTADTGNYFRHAFARVCGAYLLKEKADPNCDCSQGVGMARGLYFMAQTSSIKGNEP